MRNSCRSYDITQVSCRGRSLKVSLNELTLTYDLVHSVNLCSFFTLETTVITGFPNHPTCSPKELRITPHDIVVQS